MSEPDSTRAGRPVQPGREPGSEQGVHPQAAFAPGTDPAQDSRAEQVLSQALRVMAGGGKPPPQAEPPPAARRFSQLSTTQLVLLAVIIGLLVGVAAGFLSLL